MPNKNKKSDDKAAQNNEQGKDVSIDKNKKSQQKEKYKKEIKRYAEKMHSGVKRDEMKEDVSDRKIESEVKPVNPFSSGAKKDNEQPVIDMEPKEEGDLDIPESTPEKTGESQEKVSLNKERKADKTESDAKADVIDVEPVDENALPGHVERAVEKQTKFVEREIDEFREDFWEILAQAGITKKRILWIFIIIVLGSVLLYFLFFRNGNAQRDVVKPVDDGDSEQYTSSEVFPIVSSYIFGLEFSKPINMIEALPITSWSTNAGIDAATSLGNVFGTREEAFVYYVDVLSQMQNIYDTDVYELLDKSVDRRAALNLHLEQMKDLIDRGMEIYNYLVAEMDRLDTEFEFLSEDIENLEQGFFDALASSRNLQAQLAYDTLDVFIEDSKMATEMKAYFNAYQTLRDMYINSLNALNPRYEDIQVNTEALIKGVRVFDIPDSDIDAIIRLEN